jgi:very-short-patch-repair endonuclease
VKVALEVDGWYHRSPEGAAKDAERDSELRHAGWLVLRVDDRRGENSMLDQVATVGGLIWALRGRRALNKPPWQRR